MNAMISLHFNYYHVCGFTFLISLGS